LFTALFHNTSPFLVGATEGTLLMALAYRLLGCVFIGGIMWEGYDINFSMAKIPGIFRGFLLFILRISF
jgi:hypothetical protein